MGRAESLHPRSSRKRRLSGDFTTEEVLKAHLGQEVVPLRIGRSFAWAGLLTDVRLRGYFPFTRIEIHGKRRHYGVKICYVKTTIRFAQDGEEWFNRRNQHRGLYRNAQYKMKWVGTPYLESPVSNKGEDLWLIRKLAHMPAALPALEDGLIHEFPGWSVGKCLFLDDV